MGPSSCRARTRPFRIKVHRARYISAHEPLFKIERPSCCETATQTTGAMADGFLDSGRASAPKDDGMLSRCDLIKGAAVALLTISIQGAWAQETKMNLFKIVTIKDEIVIGLSAEELQALGGNDASAGCARAGAEGRSHRLAIQRASRPERRNAAGAERQDRPPRQRVAPRRAVHDAPTRSCRIREGRRAPATKSAGVPAHPRYSGAVPRLPS